MLAEEDHRLGSREDPSVGREADLVGELPDQAVAEGMEGRDRGVGEAVRDELIHAELHLRSGLVREGQAEDLRWPGAAGRHEPGDPAGDDLRLAGAGAGHDEQRTFPVGDSPPLLGVETAQQRDEAQVFWLIEDRFAEALPDRQLIQDGRLSPRPRNSHLGLDRRGLIADGLKGHAGRLRDPRASSGDTATATSSGRRYGRDRRRDHREPQGLGLFIARR